MSLIYHNKQIQMEKKKNVLQLTLQSEQKGLGLISTTT
jgi:hypothetical protein